MTYENKLKKEKTEILHKYSHKVGGKPVYFVKNKGTEEKHKFNREYNESKNKFNAKLKNILDNAKK